MNCFRKNQFEGKSQLILFRDLIWFGLKAFVWLKYNKHNQPEPNVFDLNLLSIIATPIQVKEQSAFDLSFSRNYLPYEKDGLFYIL